MITLKQTTIAVACALLSTPSLAVGPTGNWTCNIAGTPAGSLVVEAASYFAQIPGTPVGSLALDTAGATRSHRLRGLLWPAPENPSRPVVLSDPHGPMRCGKTAAMRC